MTLGTIIAGTLAHWMGYVILFGGVAYALAHIKDQPWTQQNIFWLGTGLIYQQTIIKGDAHEQTYTQRRSCKNPARYLGTSKRKNSSATQIIHT